MSINFIAKESEVIYEGICADSKMKGVDGIMGYNDEDKNVFVKLEDGSKKNKIRKGEIVGRISSLIEMGDIQNELNESWTDEDLLKEVSLGNHINPEERNLIHEMLKSKKDLF